MSASRDTVSGQRGASVSGQARQRNASTLWAGVAELCPPGPRLTEFCVRSLHLFTLFSAPDRGPVQRQTHQRTSARTTAHGCQGFPTEHADVWFQFNGKWHKGEVQELIPVAIEATEFPYAKIIVRYTDGDFEHTRQHFAKAKYGAGADVRWALCKAQQPQPQPQPRGTLGLQEPGSRL